MDIMINLMAFLKPYGNFGLFFIFAILIACGFGLPMPEDIPLMVAGLLVGQEIVNIWEANIVCMAGVLIGDGVIHSLGYHYGNRIKNTRIFKKVLNKSREEKVAQWFSKYGDKTIFFARFMPGLRMPIFLSSGIYKVPRWKFIALDGFAAIISVPVWIYIAYAFSSNLELLAEKAKQLQMGIYSLLGIVVALILVLYFVKKKIKKISN